MPTARTAAQWTYDAYGECLSADSLLPHPTMHAGHKGLFIDRLDEGVVDLFTGEPTPRLAADGERILYQNRNRAYAPHLGRFMQQDPNASGQGVLQLVSGRRSVTDPSSTFDLGTQFADGLSLYAYCVSNPTTFADPAGLFVSDAVDVYSTIGVTTATLAYMLAATHSANMEHDVEWASDWSLPDDFHTRLDNSWIAEIYGEVDINGTVDDYLDPVPNSELTISGRYKGDYLPNSIRLAKLLVNGVSALSGHSHHAFMRIFTRFKKGQFREILNKLPPELHGEWHRFEDKYRQSKGIPSIYDPRGHKRWEAWFKENRNGMDRIIRAQREAIDKFVSLKRNQGVKIEGMREAFEEAIR